jgi:TRAP-type C4-dicarboxylate transport system substrate-binding protein
VDPASLVLAAALAVVIGGGAEAADISLRLASVANDQTTYGQAQEVLKQELEAPTDGRVEIQIFNNDTLGSNREALELARLGSVDLVVTGLGHASSFAPQLNASFPMSGRTARRCSRCWTAPSASRSRTR